MKLRVPILMYHYVSDDIDPQLLRWAVTRDNFVKQIKTLKLHGYNSISLKQLQDYRNNKSTLPRKPVVISFDDGHKETVDYTTPILKSYGYTAAHFIPAEYVGMKSKWLMEEFGIELPIIDWETVKYLDENGFEIGSHSMTHPYLADLSPGACYKELMDSRHTLEENLGHKVECLAYPYGSFNEEVRDMAEKAGYNMACLDIPGFANRKVDALMLPRINIGNEDSSLDFVMKLYTAHRFWSYLHTKYLGLKRRINKVLKLHVR